MSKITLHTKGGQQVTSVPNLFIDNYMNEANGEYVKVYLQLLRMLGQGDSSFSIGNLADKLDYTEKDVHRSLNYWEKKNLLKLDYDTTNQLTGIELNDLNSCSAEPVASNIPAASVSTSIQLPTEPREYSPAELTSFHQREEIRQILAFAPQYIKRPLTPRESNFLLFWHEELAMPVDQIDELMQYCIGSGHESFDYMNKVALEWKKRGITSLQQLSEGNDILSHSHRSIIKSLGLNRNNLVPAELAFVDKWTNDLCFSLDLILEACDRTMLAIGQGDFRYVDGILSSWKKQGVKHIEDLASIDKAHNQAAERKSNRSSATSKPNQFNNFNQRKTEDGYYGKLVQQLIQS